MGHQHTTIVTSSHDISGKTIMELKTTEDIVAYVREWAIDKIEEAEMCGDKIALYAEFGDWIDMEEEDELDIISLEPNT